MPAAALPAATATASRPPEGSALSLPLARISLTLIDANPYQHRAVIEEQKLEELVSSIATKGLLQNPMVRPVGDGRYQLAFGHRRREAYVRLFERTQDPKWSELPVAVRTLTDSEMQEINLAEHLASDMPPTIDLATGIAQFQRLNNLSMAQLVERLNQKPERLKRLLRLNSAPTVIKKACSEGLLVEGERRRLELMACLQFIKLYDYYEATSGGFGAEGRVGPVLEKALQNDWSLRQVERFVSSVIGEKGAADLAEPAKLPLLKVTDSQLVFFRHRLSEAGPAERKEARQALEAVLADLG